MLLIQKQTHEREDVKDRTAAHMVRLLKEENAKTFVLKDFCTRLVAFSYVPQDSQTMDSEDVSNKLTQLFVLPTNTSKEQTVCILVQLDSIQI